MVRTLYSRHKTDSAFSRVGHLMLSHINLIRSQYKMISMSLIHNLGILMSFTKMRGSIPRSEFDPTCV